MKPHFCLLKMNIRCVCCPRGPLPADFVEIKEKLSSTSGLTWTHMRTRITERLGGEALKPQTIITQLLKINRNAKGRPWRNGVAIPSYLDFMGQGGFR